MPKECNSSIKVLKGPERVRLRPAVMFGSDDEEGALEAVKNIILCSLDEVALGYATHMSVTVHTDGSITISDNGRGILVKDDDGNEVWQDRFEKLFAQNYDISFEHFEKTGWLCGNNFGKHQPFYTDAFYMLDMALCATQYASATMDVTVYRENKQYTLHFEKGVNVGGLRVTDSIHGTGTTIRFLLDSEVFTNTAISVRDLKDHLQNVAVFHEHLTVEFTDERFDQVEHLTFYYPQGMKSYLSDVTHGDTLTQLLKFSSQYENKTEENKGNQCAMQVVLAFADKGIRKSLHNYRIMKYGVTAADKAVECVTSWLNSHIEYCQAYHSADLAGVALRKVTTQDIERVLCVGIVARSKGGYYLNATRNGLNDKVLEIFLERSIKFILNDLFPTSPLHDKYSAGCALLKAILTK